MYSAIEAAHSEQRHLARGSFAPLPVGVVCLVVEPSSDKVFGTAVLFHDARWQEVRAVSGFCDRNDPALFDVEFDMVKVRFPSPLAVGDLDLNAVPDDLGSDGGAHARPASFVVSGASSSGRRRTIRPLIGQVSS